MRSIALLLAALVLTGCPGPELLQPTPFEPPLDAGAPTFAMTGFSASPTAFVLGGRGSQLVTWRSGKLDTYDSVPFVQSTTGVDVPGFQGFLARSSFKVLYQNKNESSENVVDVVTALVAGQSSVSWRRMFRPASFVQVGDRVVVREGVKLHLLDLSNGNTVATREVAAPFGDLTEGWALDGSRWVLGGNSNTIVIDPSTLTLRCSYPGRLSGGALGDGLAHMSDASGMRPRLVKFTSECALTTLIEGPLAGTTDDGVAVFVSTDVGSETPLPDIVKNEQATRQLVELDRTGKPIRTFALPDNTLWVVPSPKLATALIYRANASPALYDLQTKELVALAVTTARFRTRDRRFVICDYGTNGASILDFETRKVRNHSFLIDGKGHTLVGEVAGTLLLSRGDGFYARMSPTDGSIVERIVPP